MQKSTKKIFKTLLSLALVFVVTVGGVFGVMAALNTNVKSTFVISYTAHNVNARVIGQYSQGGSPREKFGEDIVFSGEEENATSQGFPNKSFVLDGPNDVLEVYYSIFNNSDKTSFLVTMNASGLSLTNMDIKYSFTYWGGPSEQAFQEENFLAGAPNAEYSKGLPPRDVYLTPKGTETCCALIALQLKVINPEKNASIRGNILFDFDGNADQPMELFDSETKLFNEEYFNRILQKISGSPDVSAENMALIDQMAEKENLNGNKGSDSEDFRQNMGKNLVITLGDLTWNVCYLSKAKPQENQEIGDTILTLWLSSSQQEAWENLPWCPISSATTPTFVSGRMFAGLSSTVYSESRVRKEPFNFSSNNYTPTLTHPLALFTMPELGLTEYIVTPRLVEWQEYGQVYKGGEITSSHTTWCNDNWSNDLEKVPDSAFYTSSMNTAHNAGNDLWADDYIWLPSATEVGCLLTGLNLWQLDTDQRKDVQVSPLITEEFRWSDNTLMDSGHSDWYWLRSSNGNYCFNGSINGAMISNTRRKAYSVAIRPALHLNLTKIAKTLA